MAPDIDHYIVVDAPDMPQFKTLADPHTMIVDSRELIDPELHKLWGQNGWWLGRRVPPLRGWITQQLRKLAMPQICSSDAFINVDSDVAFIRPFSPSIIFSGERLALFEVDYRNRESIGWSNDAAAMLGIEAPEQPNNYVGMLICWWNSVTRDLTAQIERHTGLPWQIALGKKRSFSEYIIYGTFVRHRVGLEAARHFPDDRPLVQLSWGADMRDPRALRNLFDTLHDSAIAVMVHSKDGVSTDAYEGLVRQQWKFG